MTLYLPLLARWRKLYVPEFKTFVKAQKYRRAFSPGASIAQNILSESFLTLRDEKNRSPSRWHKKHFLMPLRLIDINVLDFLPHSQ
jgi:hypothetical protein